jgi:heptosyltransferase-2
MNDEKRHNILLKAPNWLGDLVLFTPALQALGSAFPDSSFCVVGNAAAMDIVSLSQPGFEFVCFDRHKAPRRRGGSGPIAGHASGEMKSLPDRGGGGWRETLSILRSRSWSMGITFAEGFSSALLLKLAGAHRVIGYRGDGRRLLMSIAIPRKNRGLRPHLTREYMELACAAGAAPGDETPSLAIPMDLLGKARDLFDRHGLFTSGQIVGLCPGAAYGPSKRWPAERFARAGAELAGEGLGVVVFGAPSEASLADEIAATIGAVSMAGKTSVLTLAACLAQCSVVIANDSGAAHLAAAVGAPVVAVFTSSDPSWTRPLGEKVRVMTASLGCAPCYEKECDLGYPCLTGVAPSDVAKTALGLVHGTL